MKNSRLQKEIEAEIEKLMVMAEGFCSSKLAAHTIEKNIFKQLLALGLSLLSYIFKQRIAHLIAQGTPKKDGVPLLNKGLETCQYLSLFGLLQIQRPSYWDKDLGKLHPTDSDLSLPTSSFWSYNIAELVGENAAQSDYQESVRLLNKLLHLELSGKSSARNIGSMGPDVAAYYESKQVERQDSAVCFSASFDGKGVPKIKPKAAACVDSNPKKRLGKGEKRGIMEMATVSVSSCFIPRKRSVDSIIDTLMGSPLSKITPDSVVLKEANKTDNNWHQAIHRRAFLGNQNKAVSYGLNNIKARMGNPQSRFVVPIDAGPGLEEKVLEWVKDNKMENYFEGIILDIIHVSEYVWEAAGAIFGEKSLGKSAWVRGVLVDLLHSKTTKVINDLKAINNENQFCNTKQKQVEKAINYFTNHQHKMDYKTFIEKGYPVSSALVEAACGHLVKERMEQSGMRWSSDGAQNVMDIRAVKLNDDMEDFMDFRIKKEQLSAFKYAA
jgi:hypothetical protein